MGPGGHVDNEIREKRREFNNTTDTRLVTNKHTGFTAHGLRTVRYLNVGVKFWLTDLFIFCVLAMQRGSLFLSLKADTSLPSFNEHTLHNNGQLF